MNESASLSSLSPRCLLAVYLIVPVLLAITLVDIGYFNASLLPFMGIGSLLIPLYLLFFELPHIIASFFSFADREYLAFYKKHLLIGLPLLLAAVGLALYVNPTLAFLFYVLGTMYHVIRQQTGIAAMLMRRKGRLFFVWTFSAIGATALALAYLYTPTSFTKYAWLQDNLSLLLLALVAACLVSGALLALLSPTAIGRRYVMATTAMIVAAYFFLLVGYVFFAIFAIRFVHDVTAFLFYITHDSNRNRLVARNVLYAAVRRFGVPVAVATPLLAVAIALLLRSGAASTTIAIGALLLLSFTHYYLESVMWRRGSLHRQHIAVS